MEDSIHDEGAWLSVKSVAELAGRTKGTIRKWIRKGKIEAVETDDGLRVPLDELVRLNLLPPHTALVPLGTDDDDTPAEAALKTRIRELEVQLAEARRRESELLKRLAQAQDNMGLMLRALPAAPEDRAAEAKAEDHPKPGRKLSWFERMLGLE
jgi:excisionase family DNA binding protein